MHIAISKSKALFDCLRWSLGEDDHDEFDRGAKLSVIGPAQCDCGHVDRRGVGRWQVRKSTPGTPTERALAQR